MMMLDKTITMFIWLPPNCGGKKIHGHCHTKYCFYFISNVEELQI